MERNHMCEDWTKWLITDNSEFIKSILPCLNPQGYTSYLERLQNSWRTHVHVSFFKCPH